jgi:hypothetical protein
LLNAALLFAYSLIKDTLQKVTKPFCL